ncbi:THUMP-like domain-containing protein [Allorhodopirellula solitaria]|uniref:THUMP-like domain-containing protein n=1 Tax=Allorhodopirellula solitaria TaxID=2527987 RepID=A0A5C5XRA1_9BACT|nr:methyltransferase [Allorhodopirellula solitaria]TWT64883.1 hypothetical protein CA85_36680 [Allorhodopirellula solitaria]
MSTPSFCHSVLGEITPEMCSRLAELSQDPSSKSKPDSLTSATRAVLFDIASLQVKAIRTFGPPPHAGTAWWVTRHSLQQSTHHAVAALKASWMGSGRVADLCCGLGSDLIALARRGPAVGMDLHADVLAFASTNLQAADVEASLSQTDVTSAEPTSMIDSEDWIHVDPDRRADGKRHTALDGLVPDWGRVTELLQSCRGGLVKLAPATQVPEDDAGEFHRTWIAAGGSVREQTLIAGAVLDDAWIRQQNMSAGGRSAISIRNGIASVFATDRDAISRTSEHGGAHSNQGVGGTGIGQWMVDPDAAIRAAGLTEAFAGATGTQAVGGPSGFLSCEDPAGLTPWSEMATAARVIDVVGCDDRKLRRWFRAHDGYPEVIKVRGGDVDPAALNRRLKTCGQTPMGLWIGRQGKRTYAVVTE